MKAFSIIALLIIVIVVVGGIYFFLNMNPAAVSPSGTAATSTQDLAGASSTITPAYTLNTVTDPTLGTYLTAANGMTLYYFTRDTSGTTKCTGACATIWPPYIVGTSTLGEAPTITGTLGTLTRPDGSIQVTYNGSPLYFYSKDVNPGDTNGNRIAGTWFVVHS